MLAAWSLSGAGPEILMDWIILDFRTVFGIGISREQTGQTGLLAAWSLSGAGPEILVDWIFWDFRTVFGNLGVRGG